MIKPIPADGLRGVVLMLSLQTGPHFRKGGNNEPKKRAVFLTKSSLAILRAESPFRTQTSRPGYPSRVGKP
jgi:hypothetical protein